MYIHLGEVLVDTKNTILTTLEWNKQEGYIAVGSEGGDLRVVKYKSGVNDAGPAVFSMCEHLEGHSESIRILAWNPKYPKLATSDRIGLIIVWMLYEGRSHKDMINNRKKSIVVGMAWDFNGSRISIVYEDGTVIIRSVEGKRIWRKRLTRYALSKIQWSPDGKFLLLGLRNGKVQLYDVPPSQPTIFYFDFYFKIRKTHRKCYKN